LDPVLASFDETWLEAKEKNEPMMSLNVHQTLALTGVLNMLDDWSDQRSWGKDDYALDIESESEYVLVEDNCWIRVGNLSVYVKKTDEGVVVDIYPLGWESEDPALASTYAWFQEVQEVESGGIGKSILGFFPQRRTKIKSKALKKERKAYVSGKNIKKRFPEKKTITIVVFVFILLAAWLAGRI
jgi:hypothetical protein